VRKKSDIPAGKRRRFLPWTVVFKQKIFYIFVNNFPKNTFSPQF